ncbi:MAG: cation/H(+) antiporter [Acidobacteria bacterium]|nr:MAG: cation/H(+) antiporter [Acidobacteriota bacterium]
MRRTAQLYLLIVSIVGLGIFFVLHAGSQLPPPVSRLSTEAVAATAPHLTDVNDSSFFASVQSSLLQNATNPLSRLFLQLFIIIGASGVVAWIFARCGQPAVIGEMVAGILLGPSLFGLLAPNIFQFIFAASSLDALRLLSQIGVCLFLFAVGMELDVSEVRHKAQTAVVVSHSSIVIPYFLGVTLALFLYSQLAQPGASFLAFALFMGISMSITAFPVLVRILQDHGIFKTPLGSTATACAAVGDVTAWIMLAFVVAIARTTSLGGAAFNLGLVLVFVALMLFAIKPKLPGWLGQQALERLNPGKTVLGLVLGVVLVSALTTELIGIHALFGAFLAGIVMPTAAGFRDKLVVRVENLSSVLLLPVFFAFTGLRTHIGLLNGAQDWLICLVIIAVATAGKLGGSALAARFTGMKWCESLQLGALMNTRGLMELIALSIGYDMGILSQRIFTMLVIMALVTTIMTGPLVTYFGRYQRSLRE